MQRNEKMRRCPMRSWRPLLLCVSVARGKNNFSEGQDHSVRMYGRGEKSFSVWSCIFFPVYQNNLNLFLCISTGLGFSSVFLMLADRFLESVLTVLNLALRKDKA